MSVVHALTIDVEDWFHILNLRNGVPVEDYDQMESRVEANTEHLLSILHEAGVKGTFFIVGWAAERFPELVKAIHSQGHEVASHSYAHTLSYEMDQEAFRSDAAKSKEILENLTGEAVLGFRAPGTSITAANTWALDILLDLGFAYDSSIYPGKREHGGLPGASRFAYQQPTPLGRSILEIPFSCLNVLGMNIGFAGGGYLRLLPYCLIKRGLAEYSRQEQPVNVYVHPREIDPEHPRLKMPLYRRFKSYVNLRSTEKKMARLLQEYPFGRIRDIFKIGP